MARKGKRKHSLHRSIGAVLKGGDFARESLFLLKVNSSAEELFERFPKLIKDPRRLLPVHGAPFPRTYKDMFEVQAAGAPAGPVNEVIWAISRCVLHSAEISQYVADRNNFESSLRYPSSTLRRRYWWSTSSDAECLFGSLKPG